MMQELRPETGVVLFVGYHGGAADPSGVLAHTYSGAGFSDVRLNGVSISEAELNALIAATEGVPLGLVTGDDVVCALAASAFPGVVTVAVKTAMAEPIRRRDSELVADRFSLACVQADIFGLEQEHGVEKPLCRALEPVGKPG